jgi:hypothetical protein
VRVEGERDGRRLEWMPGGEKLSDCRHNEVNRVNRSLLEPESEND